MLDINDIKSAADNIRGFIHKTPLIYSNSLSKMTGAEVYLKAENLQKTGSFKVRGAFHKMVDISGNVIAASMGNHAQAVAFAAKSLGIHSTIVMPINAPIVKEVAARGYGGEVILYGESFDEALEYALSEKESFFIHAFDDDKIIAGQGTVGLEIIEDLNTIDVILVPVGGGGLISGISIAVKSLSPKTEVIGVQVEAATSAYESFKEKQIVSRKPSPTIADGIAIGKVGEKTLEIMQRYVDGMSVVDENSVAIAILLFLERKKLVVEGAGAVTLAALLREADRFSGKKVVLVISGGNIDFSIIDRIISKGLVTSGRLGILEAILNDVPGSLHSFSGTISSHRANIIDVFHDRITSNLPIGKTRVVFVIETRGIEHLEEIFLDLKEKGFEVRKRANTS